MDEDPVEVVGTVVLTDGEGVDEDEAELAPAVPEGVPPS